MGQLLQTRAPQLNFRSCAPSPPLDGEWVSLERLEVCFRLQNTLDLLTDMITLTDNNAGEMRLELEKNLLDTTKERRVSARLDTFMAKHVDPALNRLLPFLSPRQIQLQQQNLIYARATNATNTNARHSVLT